MRGFQPQHYADGGLVQRAMSLIGGRKKQIDEATKVAVQTPRQPEPQPVVTSTPDGKFDEKRASKDNPAGIGFADGGMVRGPGTGTSDDVPDKVPEGTYIMPADSTQAIGPEALEELGEPEEMGKEAEGMEEPGDMDDRDEPEGEKVPVRLSNGEFELPPEQVQALGEAVLTVLRDATHAPVEGGKPTAKGFAPNQFFANGGTVFGSRGLAGLREMIPKVQAMGYPQAQQAPQAPAGTRDAAALKAMIPKMEAMGYPQALADGGRVRPRGLVVGPGTETSDSIPARLSAGEYVLPADTVEAVGVDQLDALREATHKPVKGEGAKAARGFFAGGTPGGLDEAYKSWQDKKTPWYMPTPAGNMEERTAEAAYTQALRNAYSGNSSPSATGQPGGPAPKSVPTPDAAPSPVAQQQSAFNASTAKDPTYGLAPTKVNAQPTTQPAENPAPQANAPQEVSPGAYRHGRGQYSDQATGMGFSPGFTGKPNAQNMAAADALDARSQADSMARLQARGFSPGGGAQAQATYDPNAGTSSQWMTDLRDPRSLALRNASVGSTIFRTKEEAMAANKARQANIAGVRGAIAAQMHDAQQADTTRYQSDNALAGTQEQANAQRYATDAQAAASRQRGAMEAEKLGLEKVVRGFDIRAGQRNEALYQKYEAAKTPEEKSAIAQQIRDLSGKNEPTNRFTVVPGGQEWDATAGAMRTIPSRVFDNQTRQFVEQGGGNPKGPAAPTSKAEYDALPKGTRFTDPNGQVRIK